MTGINTMLKKLLFITALCLALNACQSTRSDHAQQNEYDDDDYDGIELIVVSKTPRGAIASEELSERSHNVGWYEIGLSQNGKEPIQYIWRAEREPYNSAIIRAGIGDRGTIHLHEWAKQSKIRLPQPDTEKPPIIGAVGEVYWERQK